MIEKYKRADFEELFALNNLCYCIDERPTRVEFEQMVASSDVWIIRDQWRGLGIGSCIIVNEHVARFPYLWSVFVHPNLRGVGNGTSLIELVCEKYLALELHCRVDNPAQKLYFDHGFRVVKVVPGWYVIDGKKVSALKMRRGA